MSTWNFEWEGHTIIVAYRIHRDTRGLHSGNIYALQDALGLHSKFIYSLHVDGGCLKIKKKDFYGIFNPKFDGRWAVLHRPDAGGDEHIWLAYSPDLVHWGKPHSVLSEEGGAAWDNIKVGAGAPPVLIEKGWLLIYHGVKGYGGHLVYRVGVALLDKDKPYKVIARSRKWIFQAEAPYELSGLTPNVVFPTGLLLRGDELWMYYGAADTCTCLATAKLDGVLAMLEY